MPNALIEAPDTLEHFGLGFSALRRRMSLE